MKFMKRMRSVAFTLAVCLASTCPALAHHGTAGYDMDKAITISGVVTAFDWSNPHCVIHMDVKTPSGEVQHWLLELASPIHMNRVGWTKNSMKPGDQITADTYPAKNGAPVGTTGVQYNVLKVVINGAALPTR
jgi:hypothetical protein